MPALTNTDMFDLVTKMNETFQPPGRCAATPRQMQALLNAMQEYTDEVQLARNKYKALGVAAIALGPGGIAVSELLGGGDVDVAQWRSDMTSWQFRLAEYQRLLALYIAQHPNEIDTEAGCEAIYRDITSPLLDGVWYRIMPGIMYTEAEKESIRGGGPSDRSVNDVVTPWMLGNQILTYQDFQRENAIRFFDELIENFKKLAEDITSPGKWPWWIHGAIIVGAGVAVGLLGLYVYQFLPKPPKSNPRRASRERRPHVLAQLEGHELEPGMRVITPLRYRDEDGTMRPLGRIWPDAPDELVVEKWDWEEGESLLVDPESGNSLDLNTMDYPKRWQVTALRGAFR